MATVFLSYQSNDEVLARALELRLKEKGHIFKIPAGARVAGDWQLVFLKALEESDAMVILLTENGLRSQYVLGQLGSARVLRSSKGMLILPVSRGGIPDVASDIGCYLLRGQDEQGLDSLAEELNQAICDHPRGPRIFVSHRHADERVAAALISLLKAAFHVHKSDIRCTSVPPYTLPPGAQVSERLRREVVAAQLVIGIIGPETAESRYVLFELGAAWGCAVPTFPLLVRGASMKDVPGPLAERHSVSLEETQSCLQLIDDIGSDTTLRRRERAANDVAKEARKLSEIARAAKKSSATPSPRKRAATASSRATR